MYESIEDHGIVESEGQDLEYVEAVLEGRVATTGRFSGDVTTLPSSTSHSRRRQSGGRRGGRARERRQQYSRRAGRQGARDRHSHHQRQRPHAGSRMPTYDVEIITGADMILDSADLKAFETIDV